MTSYIDPNGVPRRSEHFYLDLGLVHFIGTNERHPFSAAFSSGPVCSGGGNPVCEELEKNERDDEIQDFVEEKNEESVPETPEQDLSEETQEDTSLTQDQENSWQDEVFALTDDQQKFVRENISGCGSRYGVRPELLENYRDKNGTALTALSSDDLLVQIRKADEYLLKIMHKELSVDRQTEKKAKMRRWALITAALMKQNKYTFY